MSIGHENLDISGRISLDRTKLKVHLAVVVDSTLFGKRLIGLDVS
jgi:hypothetical protein